MNVDFDFLKYATSDKFISHGKDNHLESKLAYIKEQGFEDEYGERAGILEYDGGLTRHDAELQAAEEITNRLSDNIPF
ncbi:MAG: hypothetical protein GXY41_04920 [Phycisphaerae bacterium]|nr:hypothetical protein [Phycisphaerae bacterium]